MDKLRELLGREPVRVYLYGVVAAVVTMLVAAGVITASTVPMLLTLAAAVLAVPAVEVARSKVVAVKPKTYEVRSKSDVRVPVSSEENY